MEEFLKREAYICHVSREASTTLVYYSDKLIAYYTLARTPLKIDIKADLIRNEHFYALDLARLAVSNEYQGKGVGTYLITHIIDIAYKINDRFITTDALYEKWEWYQKLGFDYLIENEVNPKTTDGLVYMLVDLYDSELYEDYFDE
jgi:GNAT superfamily N-acetyltransferase